MEVKLNVCPQDIINIWQDLYGTIPLKSEIFLRKELLSACMNQVEQVQNEVELFTEIFSEWDSDSKEDIESDTELFGDN